MASRAMAGQLARPTVRFAVMGDVLILAVAFAARAGILWARGGGVLDGTGYDPGVYYGAADALVHGLVPYRDFTLLHPPGMMLALSPFALLGSVTSDKVGFELSTIASIALGAANAVLVVRVARRMDLRPVAAAAGGVLYAVTILSTRSEYGSQLEVLANFLLLLGIWAFTASARAPANKYPALAGAALAAATSVKIWYAVPLVVVLAWHLIERRPRRQLAVASGAAALALLCINLPFFLLAGRSMLRLIVIDQARRQGFVYKSALSRASDLDLVEVLRPGMSNRGALICAAVAAAAVLVALVLACRTRLGRLAAALLVVHIAVLLTVRVYYQFYADYLVPAAALTLAAAVHVLASARRPAVANVLASAGWLVVLASAAATARIEMVRPEGYVETSPHAYLVQAVAHDRCVQSNSPMPLIELNVLSRDLDNGCPQWVDVLGVAYSRDARGSLYRSLNINYQLDLLRYLRAGQAYVVVQARQAGVASWVVRELDKGPAIARGDGLVLRATSPGCAAGHQVIRPTANCRPAGASRPAVPSAASRRRPPTTPR